MERTNIVIEYEKRLFKLLKRMALLSRKFCDCYCIPDGLSNILTIKSMGYELTKEMLYSNELSYDYDYYTFAKSTKTLNAIIYLLKDKEYNYNEDVLILLRSIFENHILSRFFRENIDDCNFKERERLIKDFIKNPIGLEYDFYNKEGIKIKNNKGEVIGQVHNPGKYKMKGDAIYYPSFYSYLCNYSHCSFGTIESYFDGAAFYYNKNRNRLENMLFTLFVFTKLLEGIVTVDGENFSSFEEEKKYYDLVYDSLELQKEVFDFLLQKYKTSSITRDKIVIQYYMDENELNVSNKLMVYMLTHMKKSLDDKEIGSIKKDDISTDGKYIRYYPEYEL